MMPSFLTGRLMLFACYLGVAYGLSGCVEDNPNSPNSPFVAACLKPLGKNANATDQKKCRCVYAVVDRLPDRFFANTLKETVINQNGNVKDMVKVFAKLMQEKLADPEADKIYELNSLGEGLQAFQEGVDDCVKPHV
jgi:hypothetical protein